MDRLELLQLIDEAASDQRLELDLSNRNLTEIPKEISKLKSLTNLNLSNNKISEIPEVIGKLESLTTLSLRNNKISEIPEAIGQLLGLTSLDLTFNQISVIPEVIGQLQNLSELGLHENRISEISETISQLQNLTNLDLFENKITEIPKAIGQLHSLISLSLNNNQISEIPEEISQLKSLNSLSLDGNQIREIPGVISKLKSLNSLSLRSNQIREIPRVIGKLQNLTSLNLYGNQVTNIPLWMQSFSNLKELDLRGNPIPIEPAILGPKEPYISPGNLQTILSFYFQSQDPNQSAPLHEAKFIIVGEGAAGKTTLARRIQDPDCPMPPPEDRTEGIDVIRWQFQQPNGQPFYVNIWDFGGQEIYHATHQFFLTARSLYTLVIDNRRENPNLYYWLNIVCLLSDNSPIFIVKNEKQNCKFSIDEPTLRKEFDRLLPSLPADFAINRGLPEILKVIQTNLLNLPHISNPIPNSYIRIRNVLENFSRSQNYISAEEYYKICCSQNIKDRQEQLNISKYLHELGICLHFQEHSSLKHLLILNPAWATNAVYQISNYEVNETKVVLANQGRFTRADLKNIWHRSEYANMHDELLELMQKFEICYPILNLPDTYIAPSLLPEDRPEYQWNTNDNLILRYQYEFMPKGIVTRFIVETHDLIETPDATKPENQLVWQKGVILSDRYARAEIIEDYIKKEIRIRVAGLQRKSLLAIIRRDFKKIHDSFKGSFNQLDYQEMIPCDCPTCDRTQDPYAYPLDELLSFIADKDWEIQCRRKGRNMVDVRRLLNEFSIDDEELDRKNLTPTTITPNPPNTYINNNIIIDQPARTSSPKKPPMNNKKIIRIVVASPGDVQTERDILADKVIPELNKGIAKSHNLLLEIDRWETDTHPGFHIDGPQGLIDEILEIDRCDILIGIFWKRFGSPIKSGETGTEHEFMTAYQAWQQQGTPEIMMYFKEKDFLPTKQDLAQYTKVLDFKENFPAEGLYWKFQDEDSFERTIRQHLTRVVSNLASS